MFLEGVTQIKYVACLELGRRIILRDKMSKIRVGHLTKVPAWGCIDHTAFLVEQVYLLPYANVPEINQCYW